MKFRAALFAFTMSLMSSIAIAQSVPTPEQLYLRGNFEARQKHSWHENHQGEELDLSERRPVVNLRGTIFESKYARPGSTLFANFFHMGKFYIVRVPDRGVKNVYFQLAYFPPKVLSKYIAAHSLLRFEMENDRPIELVAVMPDETKLLNLGQMDAARAIESLPSELEGEKFRIRNVAISAEAQWSKTDPKKAYDLKRGELGAFMQIVRFVSMQTRLVEFFKVGNPASQILLDPNGENPNDLLRDALVRSESEGIKNAYSTLFYNCTTIAFEMIRKSFKYAERRLGFIRAWIEERIPVFSKATLKHYGGIEVLPLQLDKTLAPEMKIAYDIVILDPEHKTRELPMTELNMKVVEQAEGTLLEKGLISRRNARGAFLKCPQIFGAKAK
ncbi:MAG: hypothetical protein V4760_15375 [Bdellovibrionota bacterium]